MYQQRLAQLPPVVLILVSLVMLVFVFALQRYNATVHSFSLENAPTAVTISERLWPPGVDEMTVLAKFSVKMVAMQRRYDTPGSPEESETAEFARSGLAELDAMAVTRVERLRVGLIAGELAGPDEAIARLQALSHEPNLGPDFAADVSWFLRLYEDGLDAMDGPTREALIARHGWFAQVAMANGLGESDPFRAAIVGGAGRLIVYSMLYFLLYGLAFLAGIGSLVFLIVRFLQRRVRSGVLTAVGGPVNLEVVVAFGLGFVVLLLADPLLFALGADGTTGGLVFTQLLSWSLAAALLWPRVRGVKWDRFAWEIGLTRGEGVAREIWCGVLGYLAGLPLVAVVTMIVAIVSAVQSGPVDSSEPSGFPLFQQPPGHSWWVVFLDVISMLIWAPVLEEIVFRGALYRYIHPRCRPIGTVVVTAIAFGVVHPYGPGGMIVVATFGLVLGLMREWRDSLIAPMVAHALHNGTIALATVGMLIIID